MAPPIVLCTDFGAGSPYVGQMKLVLASAAPDARILDLAHDLPPQELTAAALVLRQSVLAIPRPAILCVVIDPGVGSDRRILALETGDGLRAVVPNNGLAAVLAASVTDLRRVHAVEDTSLFRHPVSPVFHGRDIFAPVAGALASGLALEDVGPAVPPSTLVPPPHRLRANPQDAEIIYIDSFGNLVSNLHVDDLPSDVVAVRVGDRIARRTTHYAAAPEGALVAVVGSFGTLEVALRAGSAARALDVEVGARLTLQTATPPPASQSR
jgi:S-adenosylmethionine hydrolase